MSTDRRRLTSAIQRIAKEDPEIRKLLEEFRNSGGKPGESATTGSGADARQICCDGSTNDNPNPGSDTRDPSENAKDGIDPDDPANISDNLTGVTDCATGQPICFEGSDFIPPEGWEDAQSPPNDPDFWTGCLWFSGDPRRYFATASAAISYALSLVSYGEILELQRFDTDSTCAGYFYSQAYTDLATGVRLTTSINNTSCQFVPPQDHDYEDGCNPPNDAIKVEGWPEDGCINLTIKGGKIVGSKYDPENNGSYSAPRDEIELCDGSGNSFLLRGGASSTWKSIKSLNGEIDPQTGYGYLYDAESGKKIRQIAPSEFRDNTV